MADPSTLWQNIAMLTGGGTAFILTAQQIWRKFRSTNSNIKMDTEVSSGTIEIIKLLREQNASAIAANTLAISQNHELIVSNTIRYNELINTNNALYNTINELQLRINELNFKIGSYQVDNMNLKLEVVILHENNIALTLQVTELTQEIHKLRIGEV